MPSQRLHIHVSAIMCLVIDCLILVRVVGSVEGGPSVVVLCTYII